MMSVATVEFDGRWPASCRRSLSPYNLPESCHSTWLNASAAVHLRALAV